MRVSADQRLVERHEIRFGILAGGDDRHVLERHVLDAAAALDVVTPRVVHEDATHDLRRHGKEVGAILPLHARVVRQAHVGFVHQGGGLQAVPWALATHVVAGEAVQFLVHDGRERLKRVLITQSGDLPDGNEPQETFEQGEGRYGVTMWDIFYDQTTGKVLQIHQDPQ